MPRTARSRKTLSFDTFVPFAKVDDEKRMVYGIATSEAVDSENQIVDYESVKACWPAYMEFANVRAMHPDGNLAAAGVVKEYEFDDQARQVRIGVYVGDDQDWQKVLDKIYKGFSIGGDKAPAKSRYETTASGVRVQRIFVARLNEISLVDRPACPDALFEFFNSYGGNNKVDLETMLKAAQSARSEAEQLRQGKKAAHYDVLVKMIAKCGDMEMADENPDEKKPLAGEQGQPVENADGTADPEGSAPTEAPAAPQAEVEGSAATDTADYIGIIVALAQLIGGDQGAGISEAARSTKARKDDGDNGGDMGGDVMEAVGKMSASVVSIETLLKDQASRIASLEKSAKETHGTVTKMAAQPAQTGVAKQAPNVPAAPVELSETQQIEKAARVGTLRRKIMNESNDRLRRAYETELKEIDPEGDF